MIKRLLSLFAALMVLSAPAAAQDLEGTWALQIDDASIFVFTLEEEEDGSWSGTWLRPGRFRGTGVIFSQFLGSEEVTTTNIAMQNDLMVLRFAPTRAEGSTDILHIRSTGEYVAEMTYIATGLDPYPLVRVVRGTQLGPFSDDRIYDRDNAATVSDYDPAEEPAPDEPAPEEPGFEAIEDESDAPEPDASDAEPAEEAVEEDAVEEEEQNGLSDDFLDGLDAGVPPASAPESESETEAAPETEAPALVRACSDLNRDNLPNSAELAELWGDDFESIGSGLEVREYQMENGDVARITLLGERVYLNSCGSVP